MSHESDEMFAIVLEQADRLFAGEATRERLAAFDRGESQRQLWSQLIEAGLHLASVPEPQGGAGLSAAQGFRLMRRAGYYTLPVPLAETIVANWLWTGAGGAPLTGMTTLAPARAGDRFALHADAAGHRISGSARNVPWAASAPHALVLARDAGDDPFLALVELPGTDVRRNLAFEPHAHIRLDALTLPAACVRSAPSALGDDGLLAVGALMRAQQMVGAMEHCMDYALQYAMERQQFGRPIARFQAIQHMLAEAAGHYAASVAAADLALDTLSREDFEFGVAVAKARVGEAAGKVAEVCHQVHGAMGFTQEHPLHYCTRRLWSWRDEFGGESYWQTRIGETVCAAGGDALWDRLAGNQSINPHGNS